MGNGIRANTHAQGIKQLALSVSFLHACTICDVYQGAVSTHRTQNIFQLKDTDDTSGAKS